MEFLMNILRHEPYIETSEKEKKMSRLCYMKWSTPFSCYVSVFHVSPPMQAENIKKIQNNSKPDLINNCLMGNGSKRMDVMSVTWKVDWPSGWMELAHIVSPPPSLPSSLPPSFPPALHYLLLTPDSASHQSRHQYWVLFIVAALFPRLKQYSLTVAIDLSGLCSGKHSFKPLLLY